MKILFDTSALLKRYLPEKGRESLLQLVAKARPAVAAAHCKTELYSALNRVRRETGGSDAAYRETCREVERNFSEIMVVPLSQQVERSAIQAVERAPLRVMDALHVAAAVVAGVDLFVTADVRQYQGAQALGLKALLLQGEST